jgi:hypothetical protein
VYEAATRSGQRTRPQRCPGLYWSDNALEILGPEVLNFEQTAKKPPHALGYDDHVRLGGALQERKRKVPDFASMTDDELKRWRDWTPDCLWNQSKKDWWNCDPLAEGK